MKPSSSLVAEYPASALLVLSFLCGYQEFLILLRLALGLGFQDVRFVVGKRKYYLYAFFVPLALSADHGITVCDA